jgi:ABC-type lipoprotein release transport system permease subunit
VGTGSAVYTWDELQPELAGMISMKIGGTRIMNIIIMILVAAGIFNTLFVSVMERMREFGVLMAIGHSPGQLFGMVVWESVWLATVGLLGGVALAAWPYHYLSTNGLDYTAVLGAETFEVAGIGMSAYLTVGLFPESVILIILFVVGATMLAGLYPAWRAATVKPVDSIKLV